MNTGLDQYMDIFKVAVEYSAAKLTKSFEKILIEVIILFMVIPRKIVTTAEKVSSGTRGVMSFNSRRRLHQPIELTPLSHSADTVIQSHQIILLNQPYLQPYPGS